MARYDFRCAKCKEVEEVLTQTPTEDFKVPLCKRCNSKMLKVFSVFGIKFIGEGFYKTDTRRTH